MSSILMTTLFYKAVILQEEIWHLSLLGLKRLIENQKVRAKIRFGFKVKGSSQLAEICTCLWMETQHLSLQTRFVQNTLVSQNDVSNDIELVLSSN